MARRSSRVTLENNTELDLTLIASYLCHGSWSDNASPPSNISKQSTASWQSESSGIATGTEGWVKYQMTNLGSCVPELVFVYWDNPFVWSNNVTAINGSVTTNDVTPPCHNHHWQWDTPGGFPHGGANPPECTHVLYGINQSGNGLQGLTWWDFAVNWPVLLGLTVLGQADINLQFTVGLALKGSVREMFGTEDILAIARAKGQRSLRAIMHL